MVALRHLIMVVPGLGGSLLRRGGPGGEIVWDGSLTGAAARLVDPEPLRLDADDGVAAVGVIPSTTITPFWTPIRGYDLLVNQLAAQFTPAVREIDWGPPDPGERNLLADIAAFPYDFRRSVAQASAGLSADVRDRLAARRHAGRPNRVIVVAHSLGGLVARHWLATDEEAVKHCDLLITLGTPHLGSPKALNILVNGLRVLGRRWDGATEVLRGWPSMHELLPTYPVLWDERDQARKRPHDLAWTDVDAGFVEDADGLHSEIDSGWSSDGPAEGVPVTPFVGVGQRTLQAGWWDGTTLTLNSTPPPWVSPQHLGGDGTVPEGAAAPKDVDGRPEVCRPVLCRHGWFVDLDDVGQLVRRASVGGSYRGVPGRAANQVGLDIPELIVEREPSRAVVSFFGPDGDTLAMAETPVPVVRVRVAREGMPWSELPCEPDGAEWGVSVPPLEAGLYEMEVSVPGWLGPESPPVRELVGVVAAEVVEGGRR